MRYKRLSVRKRKRMLCLFNVLMTKSKGTRYNTRCQQLSFLEFMCFTLACK